MKALQFSITTMVSFTLNLVTLQPATDIGADWKWADEINGPKDNDGITAFQRVIVEASTLPKEEGYKLLFADGLAKGQASITGDDKIKALASRNLGDPDLLWSLYKEEGQKTLRYLHDTYGVVWMESLRRILCSPGGRRASLYLCRGVDGSWDWRCSWLGRSRVASLPALVLGK